MLMKLLKKVIYKEGILYKEKSILLFALFFHYSNVIIIIILFKLSYNKDFQHFLLLFFRNKFFDSVKGHNRIWF